MGLFLSQEEMWDRPATKELALEGEKPLTHWGGNILCAVCGGITKVLFRWRADHVEKPRAFDGLGLVVVCNHTSFLDVVLIYCSLRPKQWIRIIGRDSLFSNAGGLMGQALTRVGAFPIKRDSADRTAIKRAAKMLKRGELVGIMPEGTRRGKSNRTPEIHAGAAFIAKMGKVPMMPMTVRNAELIKEKGKFFRFPKITLEYGDPVLMEDFDFVPKADRLEAYTWYCMRECFALNKNVSRDEVDMVALFPDGRDFTELFAEHTIPHHDAVEYAAEVRSKREAAAKAKAEAKAAKAAEIAEESSKAEDRESVEEPAKEQAPVSELIAE